jgi:hypothetical protein
MLILRPGCSARSTAGHRQHIQQTTDDVLQVEHGSLYPALHRLERKVARVEVGDAIATASSYYRLTPLAGGSRGDIEVGAARGAIARRVAAQGVMR